MILPGRTIGILGGGQLGRMMAISAKEMGYKVAVLDPKENSPCGQVADIEIIGAYNDLEAAKRLSEVSDVITYEFENIDADLAEWLVDNSYLPQGSKLLAITQDRQFEKEAIVNSNLKVAPYRLIDSKEKLTNALADIGFPAVLKTCRGGYDGKGQSVIRSETDIEMAVNDVLSKGKCVLEKWIPFDKEISVIVTRNVSGEIITFPVAENIHVDNILSASIVPARVDNTIQDRAKAMAVELGKSIELVGTLAVEMFLTHEGEIYINELAPRPHNSGHYTMNACETSQFEQHIRAVCNWPLGSTKLVQPAVMMNILGEHLKPVLKEVSSYKRGKLHLYGKEEAKEKRKMGHITFIGEKVETILEEIKDLGIWEPKEEDHK